MFGVGAPELIVLLLVAAVVLVVGGLALILAVRAGHRPHGSG
jgi:hypothetical protein